MSGLIFFLIFKVVTPFILKNKSGDTSLAKIDDVSHVCLESSYHNDS